MRIRVDKSFHLRIIIPGVEIIPPCFRIVVVPAVTNRVDIADEGRGRVGVAVGIRHRQHLSPGIVGIPGHHVAAGIQDGDDIPL